MNKACSAYILLPSLYIDWLVHSIMVCIYPWATVSLWGHPFHTLRSLLQLLDWPFTYLCILRENGIWPNSFLLLQMAWEWRALLGRPNTPQGELRFWNFLMTIRIISRIWEMFHMKQLNAKHPSRNQKSLCSFRTNFMKGVKWPLWVNIVTRVTSLYHSFI